MHLIESVDYTHLRNKFYLDSEVGLAPCPPEVLEKLRGTYARVSLGEHIVFVFKNNYSCCWYYDVNAQEYVIKTETPSVCIDRGPLEFLLDELDELFGSDA